MDKIKELIFTCPQCGKHDLGSVEQVLMTYPIKKINSDGDLDYDTDNPTSGDGQVLSYQCMNCGFELEHDDYNASIIEQEDLIKWIKENCPQEGTV